MPSPTNTNTNTLTTLPPELLLLIAEQTHSQSDLGSLAFTSRHTYTVLATSLIRLNIKFHRSSGLTHAITTNNVPLATEFLAAGAEVNKPVVTKTEYERLTEQEMQAVLQSGKLETPLYRAVSLGNLALVKMLLETGAEADTKAWEGAPTALGKAAKEGFSEVAAELRRALGMAPVSVIGGELFG
ncbi:hypothetical protein BDV18DRAFT_163586 [Aspergillus unguis]